jgi:hypothetical protein
VYFKQTVILPFFRLFGIDSLRDLNIDFFVLPYRYKVNLSISGFPHIDGVSKSSKYTIFSRLKATLSALYPRTLSRRAASAG